MGTYRNMYIPGTLVQVKASWLMMKGDFTDPDAESTSIIIEPGTYIMITDVKLRGKNPHTKFYSIFAAHEDKIYWRLMCSENVLKDHLEVKTVP